VQTYNGDTTTAAAKPAESPANAEAKTCGVSPSLNDADLDGAAPELIPELSYDIPNLPYRGPLETHRNFAISTFKFAFIFAIYRRQTNTRPLKICAGLEWFQLEISKISTNVLKISEFDLAEKSLKTRT
jgi:hypothetical protein